MKMNFKQTPEFSKEFKRFSKKYPSLPEDLEEFKKIISTIPLGNTKHFNVLTKNGEYVVLKARLFCRYLKGSSLRIIYSFHQTSKTIEFIELYFKGEKENEDRQRKKEYLNDTITL